MGEKIEARSFTSQDRTLYRQKVQRCLEVVARMLADNRFHFDKPMTGTEMELCLIDADGLPAMKNAEVLATVGDPDFTEELGRFNLEINVRPRVLEGVAAQELEDSLRAQLNAADAKARELNAAMLMVGILPTLRVEHLDHDAISSNPRYALLSEQILAMRGEDLHLDIEGAERLVADADTIAPEAACTSVQFHLQVAPDEFAAYWNAAQVLAAAQVAVGANSPYFGGRQLWHETRIALFTQAADTRSVELQAQGVRPRVWFGERFVTNVFDLLEENLRYFPPLLPILSDEDPEAELAAGRTPLLPELRLLNGTVWRWNRPVYDVVDDRPHVRVENRVLPSGPSVVDVMANGAFYYGLLRALVEQDRPVWTRMSFDAAESNFLQAARRGLQAQVYWPGMGEIAVTELVLRRLLPLAADGLAAWGVDASVVSRLLGIVESRCSLEANGAAWQIAVTQKFEESGLDRWESLRRMTMLYHDHMSANIPVHEWPIG